MRWLTVLILGLLILPACNKPNSGPAGDPQRPAGGDSFAINKEVDVLSARAETYWTARRDKDWAKRFEFEAAEIRNAGTAEEFSKWCDEKEPFVVHKFAILGVETQDRMGWVHMQRTLAPRKIPMAAQTRSAWEFWRKEDDGKWYRISQREMSKTQFPVAPSYRDLKEEQVLLARYQEMFEARKRGDWMAVYDILDPRDLSGKSKEDFVEMYSQTLFLDRKIIWVEVVNDAGRTQVIYKLKVNDPNVRNIEPSFQVATELWVKHNGVWYLEVEKQSGEQSDAAAIQ